MIDLKAVCMSNYGTTRQIANITLRKICALGSEKIAKGPQDLSKSSSERSGPRYTQHTASSMGKILGEKTRSNGGGGGKAEQLPRKSDSPEDISPITAISSSPKQRSKHQRK